MTRAGYNAAHPGLFYSWSRGNSDANLLLCQFCEVLFIIGWVCVVMIPFFSILNYLRLFRVDPLEELVGLDISHHRGAAYDLGGPNAEDVEKLNDSRHGSKLGTPNTTQHQEFAVEDDEA
jgi:Amt family ammonium transporter